MSLPTAKRLVWEAIAQLPGRHAASACSTLLDRDGLWVISHPVNELRGTDAVAERFFAPLQRALPDLERRTDLFFGGWWDGRVCGGEGWWVTCTGHYVGTMEQPLFGIPASGEAVWLRFGEFYRVGDDGRIAEARVLLDLIDLARQVGHPVLPQPTGVQTLVPGPAGHDGILRGETEAAAGIASLALVEAMIGGLMRFDRKDLASMGMRTFWHPQMMWYGPAGVGTSRGIAGFERHHQKPFLHALPDRKGGNHRTRFAEGAFVASTGWPSIHATHLGDYLGVPASGKPVTMRVADWWRVEDGLLRENWVLIDLPHFFLQAGVDILARAPHA